MPNRILKESICVSDSIDQLNWFEEVLFYRLMVNCDDFGRFDARPAVIKARLFPLKERLTAKDVSNALYKLSDAGIVTMYECDSKPYLYLTAWEVHQNIRAKKSKYPDPEGCKRLQADASKCKQMQANVSVIQSNTNPNPNPNPNPTRAGASDGDFDAFWKAYPKKVGKADAKKAFGKVKTPVSQLLEAIEQQKKSDQWTREGGRYIPNPATWLNQGRWDDELPEAKTDPNSIHGCSGIVTDEDRERIRRYMEEET